MALLGIDREREEVGIVLIICVLQDCTQEEPPVELVYHLEVTEIDRIETASLDIEPFIYMVETEGKMPSPFIFDHGV